MEHDGQSIHAVRVASVTIGCVIAITYPGMVLNRYERTRMKSCVDCTEGNFVDHDKVAHVFSIRSFTSEDMQYRDWIMLS